MKLIVSPPHSTSLLALLRSSSFIEIIVLNHFTQTNTTAAQKITPILCITSDISVLLGISIILVLLANPIGIHRPGKSSIKLYKLAVGWNF